MYSTCLFCHAPLGANRAVELFPVGRRLAFDGARGRLWVVCARCRRWNLTPLATRWEAVEECERLFRDTRTRVATENVGLARTREGTELVRIGAAPRGEFAAWRWGRQLARRTRRATGRALLAGGTAGGAGALMLAAVGVAVNPLMTGGLLAVGLMQLVLFVSAAPRSGRVGGSLHALRTDEGASFLHPDERIVRARLVDVDGADGWGVELRKGVPTPEGPAPWRITGEARLTGPAALGAMRLMMARANAWGAARRTVRDAVRRIEDAGEPALYFRRAEAEARRMGRGHQELWAMPGPVRLALEMAANEERERRAMDEELSALEAEWREAEELAAIADRLVVPASVEGRLAQLRRPGGA